ncbi:hypothetical protein DICSQDRAFT_156091 [Dichomitus squalens LYAD-421 SS1]|uniref:Uncharacterized protein n=2 Tax=Dichomitus squalens TaxID=114155 RepID=A0A4V2K6S5_9APHY|nr:uncharacterized protein DICSQDRAFT_156091 [Dichomitus squalens LYAD-421 SS1]EJF59746.1 hypothetical protein DICSQDRAFT_156091 [Dichomitus squalens LYAD-421 SS1]TBU53353.1 hypothetical protein BD310DRAFT_159975 [Dichomitus squalens]
MAEDVAEMVTRDEAFPSPGSSVGRWVTFLALVTPTKAQSFSAPEATRGSPRSAKSGRTPVLDARRRFRWLLQWGLRPRFRGLLRVRAHVGATRLHLQYHHLCRSVCVPRRISYPFNHDAVFQAVIEVPRPRAFG